MEEEERTPCFLLARKAAAAAAGTVEREQADKAGLPPLQLPVV
jgi:hypothetical protein